MRQIYRDKQMDRLDELLQDKARFEDEALEIFKLVVAEWSSDPMSVQCFDLRIVEKAKYLHALLIDNGTKLAAVRKDLEF